MFDSNPAKRAAIIAQGGTLLGFMPVQKVSDVGIGTVITFLYGSKGPGLKGRSFYDFNPNIIFLGIKESQKGELFAVGFNTHYCDSFVERSTVVLRMRAGLRLPSRLFKQAIKAYRLDRIVGNNIYRAIDVAADPSILASKGLWRAANSLVS